MTPATAGRESIAVVQASRVPMNRLIVATRVMPRCSGWGSAAGTPGAGAGGESGATGSVAVRRRSPTLVPAWWVSATDCLLCLAPHRAAIAYGWPLESDLLHHVDDDWRAMCRLAGAPPTAEPQHGFGCPPFGSQ